MTSIYRNDINARKAAFHRLTSQQCEQLHNASLEILERTGVRLFEPEAIGLLEKAGASISEGNRVRIPPSLVEKAFSTVPKQITLHNRFGEPVIFLEGHRSFYGPGSDCLNIIDHRTGERRQPTLNDIIEGTTLCDALPHVDFVMSMFVPNDVNPKIGERYQMEAMLSHTTKPILFVTYDLAGCIDAVEMAEAAVGGPETLRQNPLLACYINVTTALQHNEEALQKLLYMAGKGLPAFYVPETTGGMTGPMTLAGNMALVNAGILTGLVLSQLKREGAPFGMSGWGGESIDMATMVIPYCAPDPRALAPAMAHYYNLPTFGIGGCSDSKLVDSQAAAEAALIMLIESQAGANLIHDLGYLESGLTFSFTQLIICHEMVGWIKHALAPVEINDETLALDLIDEIGPDGQYLDSDHTFEHFREHWYPQVFERNTYDNWLANEGRSLAERAAEYVERILAEHKPKPLPDEVTEKIQAIIRRAEKSAAIDD